MAHALKTCLCRGALGTRLNPDTIGCVWTGEFDLSTIRVDGEIFEFGEKKLRIQKYPDTCGRGLSETCTTFRTEKAAFWLRVKYSILFDEKPTLLSAE